MMFQIEFVYQDGSPEWSNTFLTKAAADQEVARIKKGPLGGSVMCVIHDLEEETDAEKDVLKSITKRLELLEQRVKILEAPLVQMK